MICPNCGIYFEEEKLRTYTWEDYVRCPHCKKLISTWSNEKVAELIVPEKDTVNKP